RVVDPAPAGGRCRNPRDSAGRIPLRWAAMAVASGDRRLVGADEGAAASALRHAAALPRRPVHRALAPDVHSGGSSMRRRATAATVVALSLGLAACSSDGGGGSSGGDLVGEGTGESCTIDAPVPVGAALSLTGGAASYGESQRNGLELATEHLNAAGGVTYELTIEDDQTDPRQGITVFEQLVQDSSIIIGPTLSNGAFQAQPVAQEAGVP